MSAPAVEVCASQLVEINELMRLRDAADAISHANAERADGGRLRGEHVAVWMAAEDEVDGACERFRLRWYPRAGRVVVSLGMVIVYPPKGRRAQIIHER